MESRVTQLRQRLHRRSQLIQRCVTAGRIARVGGHSVSIPSPSPQSIQLDRNGSRGVGRRCAGINQHRHAKCGPNSLFQSHLPLCTPVQWRLGRPSANRHDGRHAPGAGLSIRREPLARLLITALNASLVLAIAQFDGQVTVTVVTTCIVSLFLASRTHKFEYLHPAVAFLLPWSIILIFSVIPMSRYSRPTNPATYRVMITTVGIVGAVDFIADQFQARGASNRDVVRTLCESWQIQRETGENRLIQYLLYQIRLIKYLHQTLRKN